MLAALLLCAARAEALSLTAEAHPATAHIGDRIAYTITAGNAGDAELPHTLEQPEPFEVLGVEERTTGEGDKEITFTLTVFKTGRFTLPPYRLQWREADGTIGKAEAPAVTVEIASVLPPGGNEPQMMPIEDVVEPDFDWRPYLWPGVTAWAAFGLLAALLWAVKKRKEGWTSPVAPPHLSPFEAAMAAIERIEKEDLYTQGRGKPYFADIADTLRNYLRDEYGIDAPERTTQELEAVWPASLKEHRERVFYCLRTCDIAKFTTRMPDKEDATSALAVVRYFVEHGPKLKNRASDTPAAE